MCTECWAQPPKYSHQGFSNFNICLDQLGMLLNSNHESVAVAGLKIPHFQKLPVPLIKKSDKTLWLTLISSCIAFYYANETSNTVNLIPVKNMNLFSVSKYRDICVCLKYLMEVGDGVHFCNKVELRSAQVARGKVPSPFAPVSSSAPPGPPTLFSQ